MSEIGYTIAGLENLLRLHNLELPIDQLRFNDKETIFNNYRIILQKLILPLIERVFYVINGKYYKNDFEIFQFMK